jgi:glucose/mannose transport system substrate-binding protein
MSHVAEGRSRAGRGQVEIAHFWQEGDGLGMLEDVIDRFEREHGGISVTEQSYTNHGLSIKSRILKEDPPSVFVEWPGSNLVPYDEAGALMDLTDLWEDNGLDRAFMEGPDDLVHLDGRPVGIPVDIHRMNNLFYHVELVEDLGVDPSSIDSAREFLEVLEQCQGDDVLGMQQPMKQPSDVLMLFSEVVLGEFGAEVFAGITKEDPSRYRSEIRESLEIIDDIAALASDDAHFLGMVGANRRFLDEESVFFYQGDWVAAEYGEMDDFDYGEDWEHVPFPGTDEVYRIGIDSMVASANAPDPESVRTFLEFVSTPTVLEELNRTKGSIPPRRDVSMDRFPQFLRDQFQDFERSNYQPAGHAFQVSPNAFVEAKAAISDFVLSRDVEQTTRELIEAYSL